MKIKKLMLSGLLVFCAVFIYGQGMTIQPNTCVTVAGGGKLVVSDPANGMLTIKSNSTGTGGIGLNRQHTVGRISYVQLCSTGYGDTGIGLDDNPLPEKEGSTKQQHA
jgi:hypothetical protein